MKRVLQVFAGMLCMLVGGTANAQSYPTSPVKVLVAYAAGSTTDIVARIVFDQLGQRLGTQFIIDNRPGANGILASQTAAKSPADGYTLLFGSGGSHAINPAMYKVLPYDPVKDFVPVAQIGQVAFFLTVRKGLPVKNLAEFVALAKSKPQEITFGSSGPTSNLAGLLFAVTTSAKFNMINYRTSPQLVTDVLADRIDSLMEPELVLQAHIKEGSVKALAVTSKNRSPSFPDIPTVIEAGYPEFEVTGWMAIFAPAGTPNEIANKLSAGLTSVLNDPTIRASLLEKGIEPIPSTPEELRKLQMVDLARWEKLYRDANIEKQ